jgi:cyclic pyranopterin phosphate synthase
MPVKEENWLRHSDILRFEEILRICALVTELGITKIKVTGGEPLVRRGVTGLIANLKKIRGIEFVSLTPNALVLDEHLSELIDAGIDAINISLDTLNEATFKQITRNDNFNRVLQTLQKVLDTNLNIKINCVPIAGVNDADIVPLALLAKENNIAIRFIELMPLGYASGLPFAGQEKIIKMLENEFGTLIPLHKNLGNGPAEYFTAAGFKGCIGFISALSHVFCSKCNRLRLTGAGLLRTCLSSETGFDLKQVLRSGGSNDVIKNLICEAVNQKPERHTFSQSHKTTNMFRIGG